MKELFRNRTVGDYIGLAASALGLVTAFVYLIYSVTVNLLAPTVFVLMLLGALSGGAAFAIKIKLLPLLPVIFFSFSFATYISERMLMFAHMATNIYGMSEVGAILQIVVLILVLQFVSIVGACVACFAPSAQRKFA